MTDQQQNISDKAHYAGSRNGGPNIRPAIFLDRDGTITEEVGYVNHIGRAQIFPWAPKAIQMLKSTGLPVIVVTNQSGVGRGYFTEELIAKVHQKIQDELAGNNTTVDAYCYCSHHPSAALDAYRLDCRCRKPSTGMPEEAAEQFGIDLRASHMIGDAYQDMQMGFNIGARSVLLMTGYGRGEYEHHRDRWSCMPDLIAENLFKASEQILREINVSTVADPPSRSIYS